MTATRRVRRATAERGTASTPRHQAHDPDFPEAFLAVHARVVARHHARRHARRRRARTTPPAAPPLSAAFPGPDAGHPDRPRAGPGQRHGLPVPPRHRLRLADRRARPGRRAGDARRPAAATTRRSTSGPRSPRDTDEFFRDRDYGELWIGRRHTLAEKSAELGIATAHLNTLDAVLGDCAPARTRTLRGSGP